MEDAPQPDLMRRQDFELVMASLEALVDQEKAKMDEKYAHLGPSRLSVEIQDHKARGHIEVRSQLRAQLILGAADEGRIHPDERNELVNEAHFILMGTDGW